MSSSLSQQAALASIRRSTAYRRRNGRSHGRFPMSIRQSILALVHGGLDPEYIALQTGIKVTILRRWLVAKDDTIVAPRIFAVESPLPKETGKELLDGIRLLVGGFVISIAAKGDR